MEPERRGGKHRADYSDAVTGSTDPDDSAGEQTLDPAETPVEDAKTEEPKKRGALREGAIRPWQSPSFKECQDDLEKYAKKRKIPLDVPFRELTELQRTWVLEGEPE